MTDPHVYDQVIAGCLKSFQAFIHAFHRKASEMSPSKQAPGASGMKPHWASSAKTGVGTAIGAESSLWFTLSHGIVTEVYDASIDNACIRGMGLIVTDRENFFSDELHDVESHVSYLSEGVPAFRVENRCRESAL